MSSGSLCKIGLSPRQKPLRVMVLGQAGVGKSALVVRFITRRYIGEYDPTLEKMYSFHTVMDSEMVFFEILDTAGQPHESECLTLEANIRWAEAFVLMYSVTDKCSFDECNRLKFLINYNKRRRRLGSNVSKEGLAEVPVVLVGNKTDQWGERMVSAEDGQRRSKEIGCVCFHEISVRESVEQVWSVFRDVCRFWKVHSKYPRLRRSSSDLQNGKPSPDCSAAQPCGNGSHRASPVAAIGRQWTEQGLDEADEAGESEATRVERAEPFRARASTDGHLLSRPRRWRYPPGEPPAPLQYPLSARAERRMSISMRGSNASY
ncbi:ras-related and estrogen-regulated growth inhibitor [Bacillus rossius redtenbacheri]|uniref:ras-related and estrogen-regulated growth inhibitor n=1 Tax=Bacillus rossius redtenbacheri TaxID=93214 RepID=UPI002FDCDCCC